MSQKAVAPPAKVSIVAVGGTTTPPRSKVAAPVSAEAKVPLAATGGAVAFGTKVPVDVVPAGSKVSVTAAVKVVPAVSKVPVAAVPVVSKVPVAVVPVVSKVPVDVVPVVSKVPVDVVPVVSKVPVEVVPVVSKVPVDVVPAGSKVPVAVVPVVSKVPVDVAPVVSKVPVDVVPVVSKVPVDVVPVVSKVPVEVASVVSKVPVEVVPVVSEVPVAVVPVVSKVSFVIPSVGKSQMLAPLPSVSGSAAVAPLQSSIALNKNSNRVTVDEFDSPISSPDCPGPKACIARDEGIKMSKILGSYSNDDDSSSESDDSTGPLSITYKNAKQQLDDIKTATTASAAAETLKLAAEREKADQAATMKAQADAERIKTKAAVAIQMEELAKVELVTVYLNREEVMKQIETHNRSSEKGATIADITSLQTERLPPAGVRLKGPLLTNNTAAKRVPLGNQFALSDEDDDFSVEGPECVDNKVISRSSFDSSDSNDSEEYKVKRIPSLLLTSTFQKLSPAIHSPPAASAFKTTPTTSLPLYGSISVASSVTSNSPQPVLSGSLLSGGRRSSGSTVTEPSMLAGLPAYAQSTSNLPTQFPSNNLTNSGRVWGANQEVQLPGQRTNQSESQMKNKEADDDSNLDFDTSSWDEEDEDEAEASG